MKTKMLQVIVLTIVLLLAFAGSASADWWIDLTCTDNPLGPTGSQFAVTYHEDGGETDAWSAFTFYLQTHGAPGAADVNVAPNQTQPAAAFYYSGFMSPWSIMQCNDGGDDTAAFTMIWTGGAGTAPNPSDGEIIFVCNYVAPATGNTEYDQGPGDFMANIGGIDYAWSDFISGGHLYVNGNPATAPEDEDPVPPVPEFITAALLTIGLISICGYIWYSRSSGFTFAK